MVRQPEIELKENPQSRSDISFELDTNHPDLPNAVEDNTPAAHVIPIEVMAIASDDYTSTATTCSYVLNGLLTENA